MARPTASDKRQRRVGRRLLSACLLGLVVFLGHRLAMASPWPAGVMGMDRGSAMRTAITTSAVTPPAADLNLHTAHGDRQPPARWEECLAPEGVLPLPLLGFICAGQLKDTTLVAVLSRPGAHSSRFLYPPPLDPSRRRALLQIFLI